MNSNRNGNVLTAGEKDAPVKINCLNEDPSTGNVNENVTHEKEVAKSSRLMKATGDNQKNVIGPSNLNAQ